MDSKIAIDKIAFKTLHEAPQVMADGQRKRREEGKIRRQRRGERNVR